MKEKILTVVYPMGEIVQDIMFWFLENISAFVVMLKIMFPVFLVRMHMNTFGMILCSVIFLMTCRYIDLLCMSENVRAEMELGFPIPEKRLTTEEDGLIGFINDEEALLYVNELEHYLQDKGITSR